MLSLRHITHLSVQCWNTVRQHRTHRHYLDMTDQLENVQRFFTRWVYYRCQLDTNHGYIQRLEYLKLESLEHRHIYNDLVLVDNVRHGHVNVSKNNFISYNNPVINATISTIGNVFKLKTTPVSTWNILPERIVNLTSKIQFKTVLRTVNFQSATKFDRHL